MKRLLPFLLVLYLPLTATAQTWSAEEQAFLDYFNHVVDEIERNNQATFEFWSEVVHPREDLTWWFTDQGMPVDLQAVKKWHQGWARRGVDYTYLDVRPIEVKVVGTVAMIWFYNYGEWVDQAGTRQQWEDKRLEIYEKQDDGWVFVGGMVTPVTPFESGQD